MARNERRAMPNYGKRISANETPETKRKLFPNVLVSIYLLCASHVHTRRCYYTTTAGDTCGDFPFNNRLLSCPRAQRSTEYTAPSRQHGAPSPRRDENATKSPNQCIGVALPANHSTSKSVNQQERYIRCHRNAFRQLYKPACVPTKPFA